MAMLIWASWIFIHCQPIEHVCADVARYACELACTHTFSAPHVVPTRHLRFTPVTNASCLRRKEIKTDATYLLSSNRRTPLINPRSAGACPPAPRSRFGAAFGAMPEVRITPALICDRCIRSGAVTQYDSRRITRCKLRRRNANHDRGPGVGLQERDWSYGRRTGGQGDHARLRETEGQTEERATTRS